MTLNSCPICSLDVLAPLARYEKCVTSDSKPVDAPVDNVFCRGCGTAFNATGVRGNEAAFYREMYSLLAETDDAEPMFATGLGHRGINDEMVDFLRDVAALPTHGRMLEIGAGKGVFLDRFAKAFPAWNIAAVEPSRTALGVLRRRITRARIHEGDFVTSPFRDERFDLVVLITVLEHVGDPVGLLDDVRHCLIEGGVAMIGVPNFDHNPADLLIYDHLTRFTPDSLRHVIECSGLRTVLWDVGSRVPMWTLVRAGSTGGPNAELGRRWNALEHARKAVAWITGSLAVFDELGRELDETRRLAIYGTGVIAIAATRLTSLSQHQVACFVDDNHFLHGSTRLERPIVSMEDAAEGGITDIAFSANPCYLKAMEERAMRVFGNKVRVWSLPAMNIEQEVDCGEIPPARW